MFDTALFGWFRVLQKYRGIAITEKVQSKLPVDRKQSSLDLLLRIIWLYLTITPILSIWHEKIQIQQYHFNIRYSRFESFNIYHYHWPSKKICFICFNESPIKMFKNTFYFILKALFFLKILQFLCLLFAHVKKTGLIRKIKLILKFMTSQPG